MAKLLHRKEQRIINAIKENLSGQYFSIEDIERICNCKVHQKHLDVLLKTNILSARCGFRLGSTFYYLTEEKDQLLDIDLITCLKEYGCEDIYHTCTKLLSTLEKQLQNNDDFKLVASNITYEQYVSSLLQKYGQLSEPYFIINSKGNFIKNKNITKPGLNIHHIDEYLVPDLSKVKCAKLYPEYQGADRLCYANDFEHGVLHYLIAKENLHSNLGVGGIISYGLMASYAQEKEENLWLYCYILCKLICLTLKNFGDFSTERTVYERDSKRVKLLFKTLSNAQSHHFVFDGFIPNAFEQMDRITKVREQICNGYPVGITQITSQQGYELTLSKNALHYEHLYVLRTSHDICAIVAQSNEKNNIVTFYGGAVSRTPWLKVSDFYEHMDEYWLRSYISFFGVQQRLNILGKIVEQNGGLGHIHGTIIDIDAFQHLYYDIPTNSIAGYESSLDDWSNGRTVHFKPITELLPLSHNNLPALLTEYNMTLAPIQPQTVSMLAANLANQPVHVYKDNNKNLKIQEQYITHMICSWDPCYDENFQWTGIKPDAQVLTQLRRGLQIAWKGE